MWVWILYGVFHFYTDSEEVKTVKIICACPDTDLKKKKGLPFLYICGITKPKCLFWKCFQLLLFQYYYERCVEAVFPKLIPSSYLPFRKQVLIKAANRQVSPQPYWQPCNFNVLFINLVSHVNDDAKSDKKRGSVLTPLI